LRRLLWVFILKQLVRKLTVIKTASDLKYHVEQSGNEPHFFTRETMKFFGDTMRNYGVRQPVEVETISGDKVKAFELVRRRPVKHGLQSSSWFNAETFERVFPK
jgi:hypothetical protein